VSIVSANITEHIFSVSLNSSVHKKNLIYFNKTKNHEQLLDTSWESLWSRTVTKTCFKIVYRLWKTI